jgi:uncharacterized membrane protein
MLGVSVVFVVALVTFYLFNPKAGEDYTEFYLLGPGGRFDDYPACVASGAPQSIILGVANYENRTVQYHIEQRGGSGGREIADLELEHGGRLELPFTFALTRVGANQEVEFLLYREQDPNPYRSLRLLVDVGCPGLAASSN